MAGKMIKNPRNCYWLFIGISSQNSQYIQQNILADSLDSYSMQYDNKVVLGDFNLKSNNPIN